VEAVAIATMKNVAKAVAAAKAKVVAVAAVN